jgi:hypothetical protein
MGLDIRIPMGLMFAILGAIVTVYGIITQFTNKAMYDKSLGINLNLWWGLVILAFGLIMLLLAWRAGSKKTGSCEKVDDSEQVGVH